MAVATHVESFQAAQETAGAIDMCMQVCSHMEKLLKLPAHGGPGILTLPPPTQPSSCPLPPPLLPVYIHMPFLSTKHVTFT